MNKIEQFARNVFTRNGVEKKYQHERETQNKQNLLLSVGAMKAATSWLYKVLETHPDICFSPQKELHYFAHIYGATNLLSDEPRMRMAKNFLRFGESDDLMFVKKRVEWVDNFLKNPYSDNWFQNLFSLERPSQYMADFSNLTCLIDSNGWEDILDTFDNVKVVYAMRNPVERLWSHAKFHIAYSSQRSDSISSWQPKDIENLLRRGYMWKSAEYGKVLKTLLESIPKDNLKVSFMDDIFESERSWLSSFESFLNIRHITYSDQVINAKVNTSEKMSVPEWFYESFSDDVARIINELGELSVDVPDSWRVQS